MKIFYTFLTFAFLYAVKSQRMPTISYISQEQIKDIGETVEFHCSVLNGFDLPVVWTKINKNALNDQLLLSHGSTLIIRDTRFTLKYDDVLSTFRLQIKDIQETDAGFYQCKILISLNNYVYANVELQVRKPPIVSDNSTRAMVVSEGQPVQLNCYAGGFPAPRISWCRENNAILPTGGSIYHGNTLKIPIIHKEDRGTYYCIAENGVGHEARHNISVEVEFAPVITTPRPRLGQALLHDIDLECHVEAYPPPAIVWLKGDVQLSNNQHYSILHFTTIDQYTDTTIRVITIGKKQYGEYVCRAANKLGTAETKIELFETIAPVCPPACDKAVYYGAGVVPVSSGPLVVLVLFITIFMRLY